MNAIPKMTSSNTNNKVTVLVAPPLKEYGLTLVNLGLLVKTVRQLDYCPQSGHSMDKIQKSIH